MQLFTASDRLALRLASLITLMAFLPSGVGVWNFMPQFAVAVAESPLDDTPLVPLLDSQKAAQLGVAVVLPTALPATDTDARSAESLLLAGAVAITAASSIYNKPDRQDSFTSNEEAKPPRPTVLLARVDLAKLARAVSSERQAQAGGRLLMARPYVVKSQKSVDSNSKEPRSGAFVVQKDRGVSDAGGSPPDAAVQQLLDVNTRLDAGEYAGATADYVRLLDAFPKSAVAEASESTLRDIARYAENGGFDKEETLAIADQLPPFAELHDFRTRYWAIALTTALADSLTRANDPETARIYYEASHRVAREVMQQDPSDPHHIYLVRNYFKTSQVLGAEAKREADRYVNEILASETEFSMLRLAAQAGLQDNRTPYDGDHIESAIRSGDIVDEFPRSEATLVLADEAYGDILKANILYILASAHYEAAETVEAARVYKQIVDTYPNAGQVRDAAAYMYIFSLQQHDPANIDEALARYAAYLDTYPKSPFVPRVLSECARLYANVEDFEAAAKVLENLSELYPETRLGQHAVPAAEDLKKRNQEQGGSAGNESKLSLNSTIPSDAQLCGPIALRKLLLSNGVDVSLARLAICAAADATGTTMLDLTQAAAANGVKLQGLDECDAIPLMTPYIAHLDEDHYVLVREVTDGKVVVDDITGIAEYSEADFLSHWSGRVLMPVAHTAAGHLMGWEDMAQVRGGTDDHVTEKSANFASCINQRCPPPSSCSSQFNAAAAGAGLMGDGGAGTGAPGDPLSIRNPGNPLGNGTPGGDTNTTGIPFGAPLAKSAGVDLRIGGTGHRAIRVQETDINVSSRGPLSLTFSRHYMNGWGKRNYYFSVSAPYRQNIGTGWNHNLSAHLRPSSLYGKVFYIDPSGNAQEYVYEAPPVGSISKYKKKHTVDEARTYELGITLERDGTTGKWTMEWPSGIKAGFSAPIDATARYCRMEYVRDANYDVGLGNEYTFEYDHSVETVFGQLTKVNAPAGDDRYLRLNYNAYGQISKVELKSGSEVLRMAEYSYASSGAAELTKARIDGNASTDVLYAYSETVNPEDSNDVGRWISTITDRNGHETDIDFEYENEYYAEYDTTNWLASKVSVTNPDGLKTVYEKDGTWGSNKTIVRNYDGATALSKMQNDVNWTSYFTEGYRYYTTPTGSTYDGWTYEWKLDRDLTKIKFDGTTMAEYTYTDVGRISTETIRGMSPRIYEYATATSLYPTRVVEPDGTATSYYYDAKDRVTKVVPPGVGSAGYVYTFDDYGQLITKANPDGSITRMEYNSRGNMTRLTDNLGSYSTFAYDQLGNMTSTTNPLSQTTTLEYDFSGCVACGSGNGLLTKVIDPDSNATTFEYDNAGNKTKVIDVLSRATTLAYDAMHRVTKLTDPAGSFSTIEYNLLGQVTKQTTPSGKSTTMSHDYMGRVSTQTDGIGTTTYTYTTLGKISTVTDGNGHTWDYDYNTYGLLTMLTDPISKKTHYYYDTTERSTKTVAGASAITDPVEYAFHPTTGQMTKVTYTNGENVNDATYYYDALARLTQVDDWMGDEHVGEDGHFFEYDTLGRMTRYRDFDDKPGTRKKLDYTYDALGRVLTMTDYEDYQTTYTYTSTGQVSTITAPGSKVWDYDYNALKQRTLVTMPNGMTTHYSYDDRNRMTKIEHKDGATVKEGWIYKLDDDGNILSMTSAIPGRKDGWEYLYDRRNRLVDATQIDADGLPFSRESYVYDAGDNLLSKMVIPLETKLFDDFSDLDHDTNPDWDVWCDQHMDTTCTAANGYLETFHMTSTVYSPYVANDYDLWYSYSVAADGEGANAMVLNVLRASGGDVAYLAFRYPTVFPTGGSEIELDYGPASLYNENVSLEFDEWYDVHVKVRGNFVEVWHAESGQPMEKIIESDSLQLIDSEFLAFAGQGGTAITWRLDNVRIIGARDNVESFTDDFTGEDDLADDPIWDYASPGEWTVDGADEYAENVAIDADYAFGKLVDMSHGTLKFSYTMVDTSSAEPLAYAVWQDTITDDLMGVAFTPDGAMIVSFDPSATTLDENLDADSTLDTQYDVQINLNGSHIEVWWAEHGEPLQQILTTDDALLLSNTLLLFGADEDNRNRYDNISYNAPDPVTTTYTYNNGNELLTMVKGATNTTFTYDDWGRQVSKITGGNSAVYEYRYGSMLKRIDSTIPGEADTVQYIYDGLKKRREVKVTDNSVVTSDVWYRYDRGWNALATYDIGVNGSTAWDIGTRNQSVTYRGMTPLAEVPGSNPSTGAYRHYLHDHLGSTSALYDGSKALLARIAYTPYGEQAASTAGVDTTYSYTGKRWDDDVDLYYFAYRYYAPDRGRWITRDPLGMADGPNWYQYVRGNPANMIDPDGLLPQAVVWVLLVVATAAITALVKAIIDAILALFSDAVTVHKYKYTYTCMSDEIKIEFPDPDGDGWGPRDCYCYKKCGFPNNSLPRSCDYSSEEYTLVVRNPNPS